MKRQLLLLLLLVCPSFAQIDTAGLTGTVTDASNALVAGARITLENPATGLRRETTSNEVGVYRMASLPVGKYNVSFTKEGFQSFKVDDLSLTVGQVRTLNIKLDVSTTSTQVEVTAEATPLQQNNAESGIAFDQNQVKTLPMNGRNWSGFLMLAPGATNTGDGSQNSVRFNGRSRDDNNFTFDGVDATGVKDPRQEANLRLNISLDSIAEFRVSSGLYNAESGNGAGAQMNLVSKSGTNEFHGSAFEFFRNDALDARRPIDAAKPPFRLNQFGGNIGGPVIRNRTFFFANYEGLQQRLGQTFINFVPSASYKARTISTSPAMKPVMDAYKPGNERTSDPDVDRLTSVGSQPTQENSGMFKIDHRFSEKFSMFLRYNTDVGELTELRNVLLETRISNFSTHNAAAQFQYMFRPNLLLETRLGFNRSALFRDTLGTFAEGVSIPGFVALQVNQREVEVGNSYGLIPTLTWIKGRHTFKFGGEIRKIDLVLANSGSITTAFSSRANATANRADSVTFAAALPGVKGLRPYYFGFAQDEFKLSKTITLSFGTRYEYYSVAKTSDGRGRVLDFERCNGFCPAGTPWYFPDKNNWAPRFGMAWSPDALGGKTVFRMGYGIFYGPGQIDDVNAAIDSIPENYTLSQRDQPNLAFPAVQFIGQARSTGISARALQRDRRDGYSQQWTFSVQHQLPWQHVFEAAYIGGNGHKLFGRSFINTINPATGTRPYPTYSNVDIKWNQANSSFNSMQLSMRRAFRSGFQWQTQYMWGHNISDNAGAGDGGNIMISNCRRCDRGNAAWDVRHNFAANAIYDLPFGTGRAYGPKQGVFGMLASGWSLSGLAMARTGLPFDVTVNRSAAALPDGVVSTPGRSAPAQRPNFVPGVSFYPDNQSPSRWLNLAAFAVPANGTWGNLPRNSLRGPGFWQIDTALAKRTRVTERFNVEFRAEAFNLFNRAQYGNPAANISNTAQFGQILSVVNANPTGFGGPRQLQLMLRLNF